MNLKELIFGGGVRNADGSGKAYRDSIQAWLPIKGISGGVVVTKDDRFVKILEVLPVNIYLKIAPDNLQLEVRTLPADTADYVERMKARLAEEDNEHCREMIEDNIREIGEGVANDALRHRFFLVFQYEDRMKARQPTVQAIVRRLNEEADTARRYLDACELEVLEPGFADDFVLNLLYEIINKNTGRRVKLPEGVFDMTTAVHGIYEE